jgi:hypothetical protein
MTALTLSAQTLANILYVNASDGRVGVCTSTPLAMMDITAGLVLSGTDRYISFGTTTSEGSYGFRDSSGTMQFKNAGGTCHYRQYDPAVSLVQCRMLRLPTPPAI